MSGSGRSMPRKGLEYICDTCGKGMGKRYKQNHRISSLESCFKCKVCKKSFSMGFANKKIKPFRKESYSCEVCKKEFKYECFLTYHLFEHSNDWPCWCSVCKKGFALPSHLKKHMCYHASNDELKFKCSVCPLIFKSKESLKEHGMFHLSVYKWKCNECKRGFLFESDMKEHIRTHNVGRKYECSVCGFEAKSQSNLDKHSIFHTREYTEKFKLKCEVCSKGFDFQSELKQHMSKHSNDRNFQCILCSSEFKHKSELLKHKLIHTGEYKLKCDFCSKGFVFQSELKAHMRFHDESRQYQCGTCPLKFTNQTELTKHSQIHTGQYKYKCGVCSRLFPNKLNVSKHVQTHSENVAFHTNNIFENFEEAMEDLHFGAQSLKCDWCNFECVSELLLKQHKQIYHQTAMVILTYPDSDTYDNSANLVFHTDDIADSEEVIENLNTEYIGYTGTPSVKCDLCSYECDSESVLGQHKQLCHQTVMTVMVLLTHSDGDMDSQSDLAFHTNDILVNSEEAANDPSSEYIGYTGTHLLKCDLCSYECDSESALGQHKEVHHQTILKAVENSNSDMHIESGNLVFGTNEILLNSIETVENPNSEHGGMLSFKCDLCSFDCDSELLLGQHKQLHHQTVMVLLTHSDGGVDSQSDLAFHTNDILVNSEEAANDPSSEYIGYTGTRSVKCDLCDYECDSESVLGEHKEVHHQTILTNVENPNSDMHTESGDLDFGANDILTNSKEVLDNPNSEYIEYTGTQSHKCDLCNYESDSESALGQHMQQYHQTILTIITNTDSDTQSRDFVSETNEQNSEYTGTPSFKCNVCNYECDSELFFEKHKQIYHQTIPSIVTNPGSDLQTQSDLISGTNKTLSNTEGALDDTNSEYNGYTGTQSFKCDFCSYECDSELLLGQHKEVHHQTILAIVTNPDSELRTESEDLDFVNNEILSIPEETVAISTSEYIGIEFFQCDLCSFQSESELLLGQHKQLCHQTVMVLLTHPDSDMNVQSANLVFHTNDILVNSEEVVYDPSLEYIGYTGTHLLKCDLCSYECDSESALGQHKEVHHQTILTIVENSNSDMHTESEDLVFRTNEILLNSIEAVENPNSEHSLTQSFKCDLCNFECDCESVLGHHRQVYHQAILTIITNTDNDVQTQSGDLVSGTNVILVNTEEIVENPNSEYTGSQSLSCDLCSYECDSELLLGQHKQMYHQTILITVTNPDRDMQTQSRGLVSGTHEIFLNTERAIDYPNLEYTGHTVTQSFKCDLSSLCSYECDSKSALEQHTEVYHQTILTVVTNPENGLHPQLGDQAFQTNEILPNSEEAVDNLTLVHIGTQSFKCDLCNYEFDSELVLEQHKQVYHRNILTIVTNPNNDTYTQSENFVIGANDIPMNSEEANCDPIPEYTETQSFRCDLCNYECDSELLLRQHKQVYHQAILAIVTNPDNDMQPQSGNLVLGNNEILMNSEEAVGNPNSEYIGYIETVSFKCDLCGYECHSELLLEQHKQLCHQTVMVIVTNPDSGLPIHSADVILQTEGNLANFDEAVENPTSSYTGANSLECNICPYECDSEFLLEQQKQVYHQTILTIVTNTENDMRTESENLVFQSNDNHLNSEVAVYGPLPECTGIQSLECDLCSYECDSELLLGQHKQLYHPTLMVLDNDMQPQSEGTDEIIVNSAEAVDDPNSEFTGCTKAESFRCDWCGYECDSELLLGQHRQLHNQTFLTILTNPESNVPIQSGAIVFQTNDIMSANSEERS
ncbi:zinc finger protein [Trichonephila inaurata madagascariensis]|uniref:Zinc finger protein n=1 Tax=Trichonephila inaurata madagascariensis TaxID=2747483 RepID=A0A8X6WRB5_9ARAC|nr:zinc finger protein [Trichonephila inaurata madagascariensis]